MYFRFKDPDLSKHIVSRKQEHAKHNTHKKRSHRLYSRLSTTRRDQLCIIFLLLGLRVCTRSVSLPQAGLKRIFLALQQRQEEVFGTWHRYHYSNSPSSWPRLRRRRLLRHGRCPSDSLCLLDTTTNFRAGPRINFKIHLRQVDCTWLIFRHRFTSGPAPQPARRHHRP